MVLTSVGSQSVLAAERFRQSKSANLSKDRCVS